MAGAGRGAYPVLWCLLRGDRARGTAGGAEGAVGSNACAVADARSGAAAGNHSAEPAGDRAAVHEPGDEHDQELVAGGGDRLSRHRFGGDDCAQPERPSDRVHRDHRGGISDAQSVDRSGNGRRQRASPAEGALIMAEMLHPPVGDSLAARWRQTLFGDKPSAIVSSLFLLGIAWALWQALRWGVLDAVVRPDAAACRAAEGACWGVVVEKARLVLLGRFPAGEQWRPILGSIALLGCVGAAAHPRCFGKIGLALMVAG